MSEDTERLAAIQKRLGAAEPGPWFLDADGVSIYYVFHNGYTLDRDRLAESSGADAEFIAAAPSDVAFLLDLARKQQAALVEVEEWLKTLDDIEEADPTTPTYRNVSAGGLASAIRGALGAKP